MYKYTSILITYSLFLFFACSKEGHKKGNILDCSITLDSLDTKLFKNLTKIYTAYATQPDSLWSTSYRLDLEPLILAKATVNSPEIKTYYYINSKKYIDTLSTDFEKVVFPHNPYLKDVYKTNTPIKDSLFVNNFISFTSFPQKNKETLVFRYFHELFGIPEHNINSQFQFFMPHEAFHLYKQAHWTYDAEGRDVILPEEYPYNDENLSLIQEEYRLLDAALQTHKKSELIPIMRKWLAIRNTRYNKWPILIKETYSEAIEGTATYVTYKYADLYHLNYGFNIDNEGNKHGFSEHFDIMEKSTSPQVLDYNGNPKHKMADLERSDSYNKGAALGYILDYLVPNWKSIIDKKNKTQYEIIKDYLD